MEKIPSFTVNHDDLLRGIYVSRQDFIGEEVITTFDIRMKLPNREPVMQTAEMHAIEHLAATFLRNHETVADQTIYFGPMGCRTGFYLILKGDVTSEDAFSIIKETFEFVVNFEDEIPGASARDCGNYLDMNLPMAKFEAKLFLENTLQNMTKEKMKYPA